MAGGDDLNGVRELGLRQGAVGSICGPWMQLEGAQRPQVYRTIPVVVLTCECDLEHQKASYVRFGLMCSPIPSLVKTNEFKKRVEAHAKNSDGKFEGASKGATVKEVVRLVKRQSGIGRYWYVLPESYEVGSILKQPQVFCVDLQCVVSVPYSEAFAHFKPKRQLKEIYAASLVSQYVAYNGRIPLEHVDDKRLEELLSPLAAQALRKENSNRRQTSAG